MVGAELSEGQSPFEVLQASTMHVLKFRIDEVRARVALWLRWGAIVTNSCQEILVERDDAAIFLVNADAQVLQHE